MTTDPVAALATALHKSRRVHGFIVGTAENPSWAMLASDILAALDRSGWRLRARDKMCPHEAEIAALRAALEPVMRNVVVGPWYDDPAGGGGGPAVARLHNAEAAMWELYDRFGIDPGDAYRRPTVLAALAPRAEP